MQGHDVLEKIENVGDEDGRPSVTVKIINCGELLDGENYRDVFGNCFFLVMKLCMYKSGVFKLRSHLS